MTHVVNLPTLYLDLRPITDSPLSNALKNNPPDNPPTDTWIKMDENTLFSQIDKILNIHSMFVE